MPGHQFLSACFLFMGGFLPEHPCEIGEAAQGDHAPLESCFDMIFVFGKKEVEFISVTSV